MPLQAVKIDCARVQSSFNTSALSADPASNRTCICYTITENKIEGGNQCNRGNHPSTKLTSDPMNAVDHFLSDIP
jgi:hypothetical protein